MNDPATNREREADLLHVVKSEKMEPGMRALTSLLTDRLAAADRKLRRCEPHEFPSIQARAFVYEQLLADINT